MAETHRAGAPDLPTGAGPAALREATVIPSGSPTAEPTEVAEAPPPAAGQRPVRRRFLAPAAQPAAHRHDRSPVGLRMPLRPPLAPLPAEAGGRPPEPPEPFGR